MAQYTIGAQLSKTMTIFSNTNENTIENKENYENKKLCLNEYTCCLVLAENI